MVVTDLGHDMLCTCSWVALWLLQCYWLGIVGLGSWIRPTSTWSVDPQYLWETAGMPGFRYCLEFTSETFQLLWRDTSPGLCPDKLRHVILLMFFTVKLCSIRHLKINYSRFDRILHSYTIEWFFGVWRVRGLILLAWGHQHSKHPGPIQGHLNPSEVKLRRSYHSPLLSFPVLHDSNPRLSHWKRTHSVSWNWLIHLLLGVKSYIYLGVVVLELQSIKYTYPLCMLYWCTDGPCLSGLISDNGSCALEHDGNHGYDGGLYLSVCGWSWQRNYALLAAFVCLNVPLSTYEVNAPKPPCVSPSTATPPPMPLFLSKLGHRICLLRGLPWPQNPIFFPDSHWSPCFQKRMHTRAVEGALSRAFAERDRIGDHLLELHKSKCTFI